MTKKKIAQHIENILPHFLFIFLMNSWRNIVTSKLDIIKKNDIIIGALADPKWQWQLNLLLENVKIPKKYKYLFKYSPDSKILVDCWANIWKVIDAARFCNMQVFAFEPNKSAIDLLHKKYNDDPKVYVYPVAVSNKPWNITFYSNQYDTYDEGASIIDQCGQYLSANQEYKVESVRLVDILNQDILSKHKHIYLLKLDVEWAEFDILEDIIESKIYEKIEHIVCETHERFFGKEGDKKLGKIKDLIKKNDIKNIYLDWI